MAQLQLLRLDHGPALLDFERENRRYFAATIPDRGDDYFAEFDARHAALLAEQEAGTCRFHLVVGDDGAVLGRVNLLDLESGSAELGYRIAERAAGQGLATASVRDVCALARAAYGLTSLTARSALDNPGSRAVLTRNGFTPTADIELNGRPGLHYVRVL
ncbi:GNAT family N-acetyltransferase [Streptomyces xanthochromogenes]|uniref:GNAT family N-acetyltransferase n=1 Tax=Streptomyces xanthochromogenes TaxID=67384 RepID=UPI0034156079